MPVSHSQTIKTGDEASGIRRFSMLTARNVGPTDNLLRKATKRKEGGQQNHHLRGAFSTVSMVTWSVFTKLWGRWCTTIDQPFRVSSLRPRAGNQVHCPT